MHTNPFLETFCTFAMITEAKNKGGYNDTY